MASSLARSAGPHRELSQADQLRLSGLCLPRGALRDSPLRCRIKLRPSGKVCVNPDAPWVKKLLKRIAST